ncbi:MAG: hypothetical protein EGP82_05250 [Odoribacter splanchnicus]|nr:hypothetical protein [Odoribacter splanchnicus]
MKITLIRSFLILAIALIVSFLFLLNPDDLSLSANLPVYIGLLSSILLFINMFVATRLNKKKRKPRRKQ